MDNKETVILSRDGKMVGQDCQSSFLPLPNGRMSGLAHLRQMA